MDKNKIKKILLIIGISLLIIISISLLSNGIGFGEKVIHLIEKEGYVLDEGYLYIKKESSSICDESDLSTNCNSSEYYFDINSYELLQKNVVVNNEVSFVFLPKYDYKTEKLTYTYRINSGNGVYLYKGEYDTDTKEYTCNIEYSYGMQYNTEIFERTTNKN